MPPLMSSEDLASSFDTISALPDSLIVGDVVQNAIPRNNNESPAGSTVSARSSTVELPKLDEDEFFRQFLDEQRVEDFDLSREVFLDEFGSDCVGQQPLEKESTNLVPFGAITNPCGAVSIPGLRSVPCPALHAAGKGEEKSKSEKNDIWSLRRADQLRSALGWDMRVKFADLPFNEIDELLSNLFSRAVKMNGQDYPSASLKNMLGGFNRLIRRASDLRSLTGNNHNRVERDFAIQKHPAFTKTRLTIRAAIQKTARDGNNKRTKKVEALTECHEDALLADIDHQMYTPHGVQKRLCFYLMTRCGIRGGDELWELMRCDLTIRTDSRGREYVMFEERRSKNNEYNENRTNEAQFRTTYYSYEPDFVLTTKQYLRHLPDLVEGVKPDLLLQPIANPASLVWNNRVHKVAQDKCAGLLKDMMKLVGLPQSLIRNYSNKSGRATLVTRMAARGVPDETGMLVTGHHTTSGYSRYDRTRELKQEAAVLVSASPGLVYADALKEVSTNFVQEKVIGTWDNLKPLMDGETAKKMAEKNRVREEERQQRAQVGKEVVSCTEISKSVSAVQEGAGNSRLPMSLSEISGNFGAGTMEAWHQQYDRINWEEELMRNPVLARALCGAKSNISNVANHMAGIYSNCNITINVVQPGQVSKAESSDRPDAV